MQALQVGTQSLVNRKWKPDLWHQWILLRRWGTLQPPLRLGDHQGAKLMKERGHALDASRCLNHDHQVLRPGSCSLSDREAGPRKLRSRARTPAIEHTGVWPVARTMHRRQRLAQSFSREDTQHMIWDLPRG